MKTLEQVIEAIETKKTWERGNLEVIDNRDIARILHFCPEKLKEWGFEFDSTLEKREWTEKVIMEQFKSDLYFAIEKAEDERGISSCLMFEVMGMWLWILEDHDFDDDEYYAYGIHRYHAIEKKYFLQEKGA